MSPHESNPWKDYGDQIDAIVRELNTQVVPAYDDCCKAFMDVLMVYKEASRLHNDMYETKQRGVAAVPGFLKIVIPKSVGAKFDIMECVHDFHRDKYFAFMTYVVNHHNIEGPKRGPDKKLEMRDFQTLSHIAFEADQEMERVRKEYEQLRDALAKKGIRKLKK